MQIKHPDIDGHVIRVQIGIARRHSTILCAGHVGWMWVADDDTDRRSPPPLMFCFRESSHEL